MIDLEQFPTSESAQKMMAAVSPIYDNSYVAKWLFQVMGEEWDEVWQRFIEARQQSFPETATWSIAYWEQRYGIAPDESLPLSARRQRILVKRGKRYPMNPARLAQFARNITGRMAEVTEETGTYTFTVTISPGDSTVDYGALLNLVKNLKPAHLSFQVVFECSVSLSIHSATEQWHFGYPLAGTKPDTNTIGALGQGRLAVEAAVDRHSFGYPLTGTTLTGTKPDVNTVASMAHDEITVAAAAEGYPFPYPMPSSNKLAGTAPDTNITGGNKAGAILPAMSAAGQPFSYPLCGEET